MNGKIFTAEDTWKGGEYELAMELGSRSDSRLEAALLALWSYPALQNCYMRNDMEPEGQTPVEPGLWDMETGSRLYGIARIPTEKLVACMSVPVREEEGSDWLVLCLPMGALSTVYDVGAYPFDDGKDPRPWREPLDNWLVSIARWVFAHAPFALALVGHDVSGRDNGERVAMEGLPQQRWDGYLWRENGELTWYAPSIYRADYGS